MDSFLETISCFTKAGDSLFEAGTNSFVDIVCRILAGALLFVAGGSSFVAGANLFKDIGCRILAGALLFADIRKILDLITQIPNQVRNDGAFQTLRFRNDSESARAYSVILFFNFFWLEPKETKIQGLDSLFLFYLRKD